MRLGDDVRQPLADQGCPLERVRVALRRPLADVERLRAVRERVQRGPHRFGSWQPERQLGLVDDTFDAGAGTAAPHPAVRIADAEERRPLGPRVGGGDRHDRQRGLRRDGLRRVDRAAAAERDEHVGFGSGSGCSGGNLADPVRRQLIPPADGPGHPRMRVPLARQEVRMLDPELGQHGGQLAESPADDHAIRPRANSTNASAARVGVRPAARAREISLVASSPSTRAAVSVPAASSGSTADREMNVTP